MTRTVLLFSTSLLAACDVTSTVGVNETVLSVSNCSDDSAVSACSKEPCVVTDVANGREGWRALFRLTDPFAFNRIEKRASAVPSVP